ncbi:feruloyl-CoA synthase [Actinopolyspora alba]|uniref:Feruloyl-CoA synthase n=1 Tax=Actinopolyspora alba TaxID=673379 RepID=A0A1I1TQE6_9ACTN|nr:AMP-binding protein [Actinopolyspora alba]SFD60605.1 feruloyl-CoA synthase [Actinopolyspora alba]
MTLATFASHDVLDEERPDGTRVLRAAEPLAAHPDSLGEVLRYWAEHTPDRVLAAERDSAGRWCSSSYADSSARALRIAASLLARGLDGTRPMMVLSGNSLEHLMITLACYTVGIPVVPVSVAYSLRSGDHQRLRAMTELVTPGAVYAEDGETYRQALRTVVSATAGSCVPVVSRSPGDGQLTYGELCATEPSEAVRRARRAVTPESVAKILFTSGSTGTPKGVRNTHRMLCANQQMLRQIWPFLADEPPVLTDWLPWSHTFGGNHNLHLALYNGGTIHLDDGKPSDADFERTIEALREVPPTICVNVPSGYAMLADRVERDPALGERIFSEARILLYAGADMPGELRTRLARIARATSGRDIAVVSSWGATETGPAATSTHGSAESGIGIPLPGVSVKLVPHGTGLETRVHGPSVTPGYLGGESLDLDDEGYYRTGDLTRFVDETVPARGLVFEGRAAENFKLSNATWISTARVRRSLLDATALITDVVLLGTNRPYVAALGWINLEPANELLGTSAADIAELLEHEKLRETLAEALRAANADSAPSARVRRFLPLAGPPRIEAGEITDKGYVNATAVVDNRAELVEALYRDHVAPSVVTPLGE